MVGVLVVDAIRKMECESESERLERENNVQAEIDSRWRLVIL